MTDAELDAELRDLIRALAKAGFALITPAPTPAIAATKKTA